MAIVTALIVAACSRNEKAPTATNGSGSTPASERSATEQRSPEPANDTGLPAATVAALETALADERLAEATYAAVIAKHGEVRPFVNIIEAERRHQQELLALFEQYGVAVPERKETAPEAPTTIEEACQSAIDGEKRNIAIYDELLDRVKAADIRATFLRLQSASRDRHMQAFERCLSRYR